MSVNDFLQQALDWRGIDVACTRCGGSGTIVYGNTATWLGGIGGSAMTPGVCNLCWGSGDSTRPGANLKEMNLDRKDMAMLLRRLLRKIPAGNEQLVAQTRDYLVRKGLQGSILRECEPTTDEDHPSPFPTGVEA